MKLKLVGSLLSLLLTAGATSTAHENLFCRKYLDRFSSQSEPAKFWEHLHHSLTMHQLFLRVKASDLPSAEKALVEALEQDRFAPTDSTGKNLPPYLLGSIEYVVDLLERGLSSFERTEGPRNGPLGYERVGYRVIHPDQKVSYLMSKRLTEGCATCRERENLFLVAQRTTPLFRQIRVTKVNGVVDVNESPVAALAAELQWSTFWGVK